MFTVVQSALCLTAVNDFFFKAQSYKYASKGFTIFTAYNPLHPWPKILQNKTKMATI